MDVSALGGDLKALNGFLATRSYITGYAPSADDVTCFAKVGSAPDQNQFLNAARWYKHIASFADGERGSWPAGKGSVTLDAGAASGGGKKDKKGGGEPPKKKEAAPPPPPVKKEEEEEEEEDDDLFGSDTEEDRAHEAALKAKVAAARAGKAEKPKVKQRSLIVLEVKPHEVETDLEAMALGIKEIEHPGIQNWGLEHKLLPVAYGIMKLAISVVVWDDDIDTEMIEDMLMEKYPDEIQSIDVAAMSKV